MLRRLLWILAAMTVTVSLLPLGARQGWVLDLFSHFRLQYLAVQLGLIVALALTRSRRWLLLVAAVAAITVLPLAPYLPLAAETAATGTRAPLEVLSLNVQQRNLDYAHTVELVTGTRADLVLVLELTPGLAAELDKLDALYPYRLLRPEHGPFGIGLLSRRPLAGLEVHALGPTLAIEASLEVGRRTVDFVGVHLMPPMSEEWAKQRAEQLELLAELAGAAERPRLVCGDFNLTPYSPHFGDLLARTGLRDGRDGRGFQISWPTFMPLLGIPIDHCLVSPDIGVADSRRLAAFGSDHYPVLFDLFVEGKP